MSGKISNDVLAERIANLHTLITNFRKEVKGNFKDINGQVKKNTQFRQRIIGSFKFIGGILLLLTILSMLGVI